MDDRTDRELLLELANDVKWIREIVEKHLAEHHRLLLAGIGVSGSLLIGLLLALVT